MSLDPHAAVPGHLTAILADLVEIQRRLSVTLAATTEADVNLVKLGSTLTKSTIDLSRELRAWSRATKENAKTLSVGDRMGLVVAFIRSLAAADRREFDRMLEEAE